MNRSPRFLPRSAKDVPGKRQETGVPAGSLPRFRAVL